MRALLLFAVCAGCYEPSVTPCSVRCAGPADCAGGLVCGADGWCTDDRGCGQLGASDAAVAIDARQPDGPPACAPGCMGSCESGVCVLRCSGPNECADQEIRCPLTGPCRVECTGNKSCQKKVVCGGGPCEVACEGPESCKDGVQCGVSCACDVTCSGSDACEHAATCRAPACDTGAGCSSAPAGCETCP